MNRSIIITLTTIFTVCAHADSETGKAVFDEWCATCHAAEGMMPGTIALEAKYQDSVPAALEERTDMTPEFIRHFVRKGVSVMAPFRKTEISDKELDALAAYLTAPE